LFANALTTFANLSNFLFLFLMSFNSFLKALVKIIYISLI